MKTNKGIIVYTLKSSVPIPNPDVNCDKLAMAKEYISTPISILERENIRSCRVPGEMSP